MKLTKAQQKVFDEAQKRLEKHSWFRGICLDNFPSDEECKNFEEAVASVEMETAYWDAPQGIFTQLGA